MIKLMKLNYVFDVEKTYLLVSLKHFVCRAAKVEMYYDEGNIKSCVDKQYIKRLYGYNCVVKEKKTDDSLIYYLKKYSSRKEYLNDFREISMDGSGFIFSSVEEYEEAFAKFEKALQYPQYQGSDGNGSVATYVCCDTTFSKDYTKEFIRQPITLQLKVFNNFIGYSTYRYVVEEDDLGHDFNYYVDKFLNEQGEKMAYAKHFMAVIREVIDGIRMPIMDTNEFIRYCKLGLKDKFEHYKTVYIRINDIYNKTSSYKLTSLEDVDKYLIDLINPVDIISVLYIEDENIIETGFNIISYDGHAYDKMKIGSGMDLDTFYKRTIGGLLEIYKCSYIMKGK